MSVVLGQGSMDSACTGYLQSYGSVQDLQGALATLEPLELTPETNAHWAQLAEAALEQEALAVAERCYAAVGDVAKARYLHKVGPPARVPPSDCAPARQFASYLCQEPATTCDLRALLHVVSQYLGCCAVACAGHFVHSWSRLQPTPSCRSSSPCQ